MRNRTFRTQGSRTFCPESHDFELEISAFPALFPHPSPGPNKGNPASISEGADSPVHTLCVPSV